MDNLKDIYTIFLVYKRLDPFSHNPVTVSRNSEKHLKKLVGSLAKKEVTVRGIYDVSGLRADADIMLWLHAPTAPLLQWAARKFNQAQIFNELARAWSALGLHRDAEFNKQHIPGFLRGERARDWLTVYPFVRSYDWYVLPDEERQRMLAEHGRKGAVFKGVVANTVSAFALNDYEWILPMESDNLADLVDLMRDLRATDARLHVREEVPFFTGRKISIPELLELFK